MDKENDKWRCNIRPSVAKWEKAGVYRNEERECSAFVTKIHSSQALLQMIQKLGKKPFLANDILNELLSILEEKVSQKGAVQKKGLQYLRSSLAEVAHEELAVCHCDVNHNNWILSDDNELYLIDWDGAVIADPALDIGMLLYWYVPQSEWKSWLKHYDIEMTNSLFTPYGMVRYCSVYYISAVVYNKGEAGGSFLLA
ncbi:hypothetical protein GCM10020331_031040 [Ectobacillus funiculus]